MELDEIKRNVWRLEYGNLRNCTTIQDGVLLVNSTATCNVNNRILLEEALDRVPTIFCNDSIGPVWTIDANTSYQFVKVIR